MPELDFKELIRISDAVSPHLQGIIGVTGVGVQVEGLTVYLDHDSEQLRSRVAHVVKECAGNNTEIHFEILGRFKAATQI
jgi:hypothetical protein